MANTQENLQPQSGNKPRSRRMSVKVDFTAMVDLAFLLITFFMLTTELTKPSMMPIVMPDDSGETTDIKASHALTLLLDANDKLYYYEGLDAAHKDSTDFSAAGLRKLILDKQDRIRTAFGDDVRPDPKRPSQMKTYSKLYVMIKASPKARYKNVVDVFDEMKICNVAHYALLD
jgi:biopolymer transport protein ExbD